MPIMVIDTPEGWMINCPYCGWHVIPNKRNWKFNGNYEKPTFTPSIDETSNPPGHKDYRPDVPTRRCHFTITDGKMTLHKNCTHGLKSTTVDMKPFEQSKIDYYASLKEAAESESRDDATFPKDGKTSHG